MLGNHFSPSILLSEPPEKYLFLLIHLFTLYWLYVLHKV